ncbi:MAG: hypothetical protein EPN97_16720 [Alphaproteobacteria bacterium]|nr:MAG: hypothetical protein EPN97_16720 [Alphaproteobacteria bacterium]
MALIKRNLMAASFMAFFLALSACTSVVPVPGGTDANNENYFKSADDLREHVGKLQAGMEEAAVFSALERERNDFLQLNPEDVWRLALSRGVVAGGDNPVAGAPGALTGYRLRYKSVTRRHGMSSPIRIRTDESGFSYELTLLFRNGRLLDNPVLSGGAVNEVRTHTLFDYLTPATTFGYMR